jgi:hypothetical protein
MLQAQLADRFCGSCCRPGHSNSVAADDLLCQPLSSFSQSESNMSLTAVLLHERLNNETNFKIIKLAMKTRVPRLC